MTSADRVETALEVPRDHPAFDGHFPGHPILPGVVMLAEALCAIEEATGRAPRDWTLATCKFTNPVSPGTRLTLAHESIANGGVRFEIRGDGGVVASGTLAARTAP